MMTIGLSVALAYLIVINGLWMYTELIRKEHWFKIGEPKRPILYLEWALAILSIGVLSYLLFGGMK
jgi:hypothetical protein